MTMLVLIILIVILLIATILFGLSALFSLHQASKLHYQIFNISFYGLIILFIILLLSYCMPTKNVQINDVPIINFQRSLKLEDYSIKGVHHSDEVLKDYYTINNGIGEKTYSINDNDCTIITNSSNYHIVIYGKKYKWNFFNYIITDCQDNFINSYEVYWK